MPTSKPKPSELVADLKRIRNNVYVTSEAVLQGNVSYHDRKQYLQELCSLVHDITEKWKNRDADPVTDDEWESYPPPKSVFEVMLRYPDYGWEVCSMDDLTAHDYRIVRAAPSVNRTIVIWIIDKNQEYVDEN